jgi:beta-glucanase (GH16 family)
VPVVSTTPTSPAPIAGGNQNLVWSSSFGGAKGAPPPAAWTADAGSGCGAGTLSTTTSPANIANAQLDGNGNLAITALQTGPNSYSSAELSTIGSFSFMYGTIEARIWMPAGQGLCSAFWMVGNGPTQGQPCGPTCGELDVIEAPSFGALPTTAVFTLHGPIQGSAQTQQFETDSTALGNLAAGYHTYAATWTPTSITWSIDGVVYGTATPNNLVAGSQWSGTYSGDPFHIVLDLAVGGWPCSGNACTPPASATMLVNWVAVYQ